MKKVLFKFGILFIIYFILSQIALSTLPFSWGNTRLNTKYEEYKKNYLQYNTVFVGASTTYRHIDPKEFDAYINTLRPDLQIKSFNFGIPANRTPQSVYMLQNLLKLNGNNIKYVVLDLSELTKMGVENLHKKEMIYWYGWNNIGDMVKASYESEKSIPNKVTVPFFHAFSFAEKSLMVGMGSTLVEQKAGLNVQPLSLGPDKNGFYSLNQEMLDDPEGDLARRYNVLHAQDTIDFRTKRCQMLYDKFKDDKKSYSKTMAKELDDVIALCKKNNIKLVIMLSQRLGDRYEYLLPLYNQLPDAYKVSFANPKEFPELNDPDNLFDFAHLNAKGAAIFTKLFADRFLQRVDMQNAEKTTATQLVNDNDKNSGPGDL